ncbi:MAG: glycosyltransferase [Acidobacteria bacterium]|nr:glycosyltransferase [Acidobacteriota bacterium]
MSIPLIGIPVLNRGDLLARCVNSIDYPAERIVVINNGDDESVQAAVAGLQARRPNVEVIKPPHNLGVAGSWNYFLREYDAPYYLICGSDIQFAPGDLEKIDRFASAHPDDAIMFGNHGYSLFALARRGVELIGYFDENFYPAYLEDCDHSYRLKLLNARASNVPDIHAIHGEAPHWGSSTILSDATFRERNGITHGNNFAYYRAKWGGINGEEVYPTPFNDPSRSPAEWTLDAERRAANDIWGAGAGRRRQQVRGGGMEKKFTVITPTILRPLLRGFTQKLRQHVQESGLRRGRGGLRALHGRRRRVLGRSLRGLERGNIRRGVGRLPRREVRASLLQPPAADMPHHQQPVLLPAHLSVARQRQLHGRRRTGRDAAGAAPLPRD